MSLKIYEWEHEKFEDLYNIHLLPEVRETIIYRLAKRFDIKLSAIGFTLNKNGQTWFNHRYIELPKQTCPLGLVLHELTHLYSFQKYGDGHHGRVFKKSLIKLMIETRFELNKLLKI